MSLLYHQVFLQTALLIACALLLVGMKFGSWHYRRKHQRECDQLRESSAQLQQLALVSEERLRYQNEVLAAKDEQAMRVREELRLGQERIAHLCEQLGRTQGHLDEEVRKGQERSEWTAAQQNEWLLRFQSASDTLMQSSKALFLEQNQLQLSQWRESVRHDQSTHHQQFDGMLRPLRECIDQLHRKREEEGTQWGQVYGALREQLRGQAENHLTMQREMQQLSHALRTPQGCGRWGELQLRRVVEIAGMLPYCDFDLQVASNADRGNFRPDMVIRLPSQRQLIIDAKAPIQAYLEAQTAATPEQRTRKLKEHADTVRKHSARLSQKEYWQDFKPAPEFTVLFLPGEAIFSAALEADPLLMEWTARQNIILATPTTLIALLKAIAYGWRQQRSEENARQIAQLGSQLYDRLKKFSTSLEDLRLHLVRSVNAFNKTAGSWENRVLVSARKLHEMNDQTEESLSSPPSIETSPRPLRESSDSPLETIVEPQRSAT